MAIFLSTFVNPIDNKGRVVVPKEFRLVLDKFHGFVAFRSHNSNAIDCFSMERMEKLSQQIDDNLDPFSIARDSLESAVFADAVTLRFDKDGRVVLPESLLGHAGIYLSDGENGEQVHIKNGDTKENKNSQKIAFVGRGTTFQLWQPDEFKKHQDLARAKLLDEQKKKQERQ